MLLQGTAPGPPTIKLSGLFGSFRVGTNPTDYIKINFVSTYANPRKHDGHAELVKQLKPMRERLQAADIKDLRSLLQRDLDDNRVAHDLIPYLRGENTQGIGFFPAILAVLVPKGYLANKMIAYPAPVPDTANPLRVGYGDGWTAERYKTDTADTQGLPVGLMEIMPARADIIVLDGQHRANAFRFMAGDFDQSDEIYQTFYDGVAAPAADFDADLPVTLIWFEAVGNAVIEPNAISRKLFVDVNNSAKRVSTSRTILLDDRAATCIGTTQFYNEAARSGFAPGQFSLLHSGFDMDSDIAQGRTHRFMLTTPELINNAFMWAFFGGNVHDNLAVSRISRDFAGNRAKFALLFPGFDDLAARSNEELESYRRLLFDSFERAEAFRDAFNTNYLPVMRAFFQQLSLLAPHYEACIETENWARHTAGTAEREVWNKVFCGGEGLYWSLRNAPSDRAANYQKAIGAVETHFAEARAERFDRTRGIVDAVYDSFLTKAFQAGFVGAVEYLTRYNPNTEGDYLASADDLINRLNEYSLKNWATLFMRLRPALLGNGVDPKAWPTYRNVLVRLFDGERGEMYRDNNRSVSPDWLVYQNALKEAAVGYGQTVEQMPDDTDLRLRASALLAEAENLLLDCGLTAPKWFNHDTVLGLGFDYLKSEVAKQLTLFG